MELHNIDAVPPYLRINPYVTTGYRFVSSHADACRSLFHNHNCSADTWTSVFTFVHAWVLYLCFSPRDSVFFLHLLNGILHAPPSVAYHLLGCSGIGESWFFFYQSLDYLFIFISSVPLLVALGSVTPGYPLTIGLFLLLCLCCAVAVRLVRGHRYTPVDRLKDMLCLVCSHSGPVLFAHSTLAVPILCSYAIGGAFYTFRIPERYKRGTWFTSHAWMHVFINVAYHCQFHYLRIVK